MKDLRKMIEALNNRISWEQKLLETYILTLPKLLNGIKTAFAQGYGNEWFDEDGKLDIFQIDGAAADVMVQCALFGEVVFS